RWPQTSEFQARGFRQSEQPAEKPTDDRGKNGHGLVLNTQDVLNLVHELEEKGASLRALEPAIDTGGPMGRMVLTVLGIVAELELGFISDRHAPASTPRKRRALKKAVRLRLTVRALYPFAKKEWAPLRLPRLSGASKAR